MNFVKGKMYIYLKVLFTIVYINIFIKNVHSMENKNLKGQETKKVADEQNPNENTSHNNVRPIKGVIFGKRKNGKCEKLKNNDLGKTYYQLNACSGKIYYNLYKYYTTNEMCVFSDEIADCLIYDKTAYSFFPGNVYTITDYVLPLCADESKDWTIIAKCKNAERQSYTCNGEKWIGYLGNNITNCESDDSWEDILKEDREYRIILEKMAEKDDNDNHNHESKEKQKKNLLSISNSSINLNKVLAEKKRETVNEVKIIAGKPIKGAIFGKKKEDKCQKLNNVLKSPGTHYDLDFCKSEKHNHMWKFYSVAEMCEFSFDTPDCLMYDKTGYSFFPESTYTITDYDLPPCIYGSKDWTIAAKCKDAERQNYTCNGDIWIGDRGNNITNCESDDNWYVIFKEHLNYLTEMIESRKSQSTQQNMSINIKIISKDEASDDKNKEDEKPDAKNEKEKTITEKKDVDEKQSDDINNKNKSDDKDNKNDDNGNISDDKNKKNDDKDNKNDDKDKNDNKDKNRTNDEYIIKKRNNENTTDSNHTSHLSSGGRIGISFGILIAVLAIFV